MVCFPGQGLFKIFLHNHSIPAYFIALYNVGFFYFITGYIIYLLVPDACFVLYIQGKERQVAFFGSAVQANRYIKAKVVGDKARQVQVKSEAFSTPGGLLKKLRIYYR
jgi:hypothetical protein